MLVIAFRMLNFALFKTQHMKFDKNTVIGLFLIFAVVIGFSIWQSPSKEDRARQIAQRDSTLKAMEHQRKLDSAAAATLKTAAPTESVDHEIVMQLSQDSIFAHLPAELQQAKMDSVKSLQLKEQLGSFADQAQGKEELIEIETDLAIYSFSNKGGQLKNIRLKEFKKYQENKDNAPLVDMYQAHLSGMNIPIPLNNGKMLQTADMYFSIDGASKKISGDETAQISMKLYAGSNQNYIEYLYIIKANDYMADFRINIVDIGKELLPGSSLKLNWHQAVASQEKDATLENQKSTITYWEDGSIDDIGFGTEESEEIEKPVKWIGFTQQFFTTTLISDASFSGKIKLETKQVEASSDGTIRTYQAELPLAYAGAGTESYKMRLYAGPKDFKILKKYDLELEDQINLGWKLFRWINTLFIINVFQWLDSYNLSYGIIILILTLMVKTIVSPVTYKTFLSSAKMRVLKPDVDALNEKFKDADPMKKQQALMALYNKAGVNPLAGCIPALLQMPILFAMFSFFPASIELRGEGFLWADDLSSWDSIYKFPGGFSIPFYGGHISLFAILMTVTTVMYTKMSQNMSTMTGPQAAQMKIMMYVMPVAFLVFLNSYSAALSYYYFLSNLISIIQTLIIRYFIIDENKLRAKIEENKARPESKKKGGFAARLEEMQKIQQQRSEELKKKKKN